MSNIPVYDLKGKAAGKFALDGSYFDGKINKALLQQAVLMYLSNRRLGTASNKSRSQVRGGGRKPWRQKGTGRARVGSIRSPIWRGGGVVFGGQPKEFRQRLAKNAKNLALKMSLNAKIRDNEIVVVDKFSPDMVKTKHFFGMLKALKAKEAPLVVLEKHNLGLWQAARNIRGLRIKAFNNINALDVLRHKKVIFSKQALENLLKLRKR